MWSSADEVLRCVHAYGRYKGKADIFSKILRRAVRWRHKFWSVISGSDIDPRATIGINLQLPHPNGVVIHRDAVIGDHCMLMQQVTIGQLAAPEAPRIGSRVYIGAGAKVLGGVNIGDDVAIGANAVVLCDVPAGYTAVGIPAIARPPKKRKSHGSPSSND